MTQGRQCGIGGDPAWHISLYLSNLKPSSTEAQEPPWSWDPNTRSGPQFVGGRSNPFFHLLLQVNANIGSEPECSQSPGQIHQQPCPSQMPWITVIAPSHKVTVTPAPQVSLTLHNIKLRMHEPMNAQWNMANQWQEPILLLKTGESEFCHADNCGVMSLGISKSSRYERN